MIESLVGSGASKYKVVSSDTNSWELQSAPLSAGDDEWSTVEGSTWTVDFSAIDSAISDLTADVAYISSELSDAMMKTDFAALSNDIGLSAASVDNPVATKNDIASLDKVMHFRGVVTGVPTSTEGYEVGDIVIVAGSSTAADNGKEFVLANLGTEAEPNYKWELIGDQNAISAVSEYVDTKISELSNEVSSNYATLTGVAGISAELTGMINTVSGETLTSANAYTDTTVGTVSATLIGNDGDAVDADTIYGAKAYADAAAAEAVADLSDYALSADVTALVDSVSAETLTSANAYTDDKAAGILSDYFILECGGATAREGEPTVPFGG
jgi:hypothetical protein